MAFSRSYCHTSQLPHCHMPCSTSPLFLYPMPPTHFIQIASIPPSTSASSSFQPLRLKIHNLIPPDTLLRSSSTASTSYVADFSIHLLHSSKHSAVYLSLLPPYFYLPLPTSLNRPSLTFGHPNSPTCLLILLIQLALPHCCMPVTPPAFLSSLSSHISMYQTVHTSLLNSRLLVEIPSQSLVVCLYVCKVPTPKNIWKACCICSVASRFLIDL